MTDLELIFTMLGEVSSSSSKMNRLVLRFRKTEPGTAFANAWSTSPTIRDLGASAPQPTPSASGP